MHIYNYIFITQYMLTHNYYEYYAVEFSHHFFPFTLELLTRVAERRFLFFFGLESYPSLLSFRS